MAANDPQIHQRNASDNGFNEVNGAENIRTAISAAAADLSGATTQAALRWGTTSKIVFGHEYMVAIRNAVASQSVAISTIRAAFAGDSTVQGSALTYAESRMDVAFRERLLQHVPSATIYNRGYAGESTVEWLATRLPADLALPQLKLYVIRWGLNDAPDVAAYITRIRTGLATIRATSGYGVAGCSVILMTPNTSDEGDRTPEWHEAINEGLRQAAIDFQCGFIDTYSLAPDPDGTSLWLDSIKLHPTDPLAAAINEAVWDLAFAGMENFSGSKFKNLASIHGTPTATNPPSAYPDAQAFYRATAGGGWPHDGFFVVQKHADAYWSCWNFGTDGGVAVRTATSSAAWGGWSELNNLVHKTSAGVVEDSLTGLNLSGTGVATPPTGVNYGVFPYQGVGTGFASAANGYGWFVGSVLHGSLRSDTGFSLRGTNTAGGTTGAQTINRPVGIVNFAAAATSLVVTNSLVGTASVVVPVLRTNDATAALGAAVCGAGFFTIHMKTAPAAETSVGFVVVNPILN